LTFFIPGGGKISPPWKTSPHEQPLSRTADFFPGKVGRSLDFKG
jgi:hypothetical protein